jgi:hypothetical protein
MFSIIFVFNFRYQSSPSTLSGRSCVGFVDFGDREGMGSWRFEGQLGRVFVAEVGDGNVMKMPAIGRNNLSSLDDLLADTYSSASLLDK